MKKPKGATDDGYVEGTAVHTAGFIEGYTIGRAHGSAISPVLLTQRVADILQADRQHGFEDPVPALRVRSAVAAERIPEVEKPRGARGRRASSKPKRVVSAKMKRRLSRLMRQRWADSRRRGQKKLMAAAA